MTNRFYQADEQRPPGAKGLPRGFCGCWSGSNVPGLLWNRMCSPRDGACFSQMSSGFSMCSALCWASCCLGTHEFLKLHLWAGQPAIQANAWAAADEMRILSTPWSSSSSCGAHTAALTSKHIWSVFVSKKEPSVHRGYRGVNYVVKINLFKLTFYSHQKVNYLSAVCFLATTLNP